MRLLLFALKPCMDKPIAGYIQILNTLPFDQSVNHAFSFVRNVPLLIWLIRYSTCDFEIYWFLFCFSWAIFCIASASVILRLFYFLSITKDFGLRRPFQISRHRPLVLLANGLIIIPFGSITIPRALKKNSLLQISRFPVSICRNKTKKSCN